MTPRARNTIALIAARRAFMARRPRARKRLPRQLQPDTIRVFYATRLRWYLTQAREMLERKWFPRARAAAERAANARHTDRFDDELNDEADKVAAEFFDLIMKPSALERDAGEVERRTNTFQREQMQKQAQAALGVDVLGAEPELVERSKSFVAENVALIKSIPSKYFDDVEKTVMRGISEGKRWEVIARDLQDRFNVSESSANLIARDQVGKYFGDLNKERQRKLGVTEYVWRTSNDERVREEHAEREGERFSWSDPPEDGHPGHAINCRCTAEPVFDDILAGL